MCESNSIEAISKHKTKDEDKAVKEKSLASELLGVKLDERVRSNLQRK